jgi:hypothetical protein
LLPDKPVCACNGWEKLAVSAGQGVGMPMSKTWPDNEVELDAAVEAELDARPGPEDDESEAGRFS